MSAPEDIRALARRVAEKVGGPALTGVAPGNTQDETLRHLAWWAEAAEAMEVPTIFRDLTRETILPTLPTLAVTAYLEPGGGADRGQCLILAGKTGTGKTLAAVVGLRERFLAGRGGRFWYVPSLCRHLLDPDGGAHTMEAVKRVGFLLLDDLGSEYLKPGGALERYVDELFWAREGNRLPTLVTTNLDAEGLKDRLSDRIWDRLVGGWARVVEMAGPSLRRLPEGQKYLPEGQGRGR